MLRPCAPPVLQSVDQVTVTFTDAHEELVTVAFTDAHEEVMTV